ncbi:MAG: hypothetical protein AB8G99_12455 [Planctomycetaceae bacterium]
MNAASVLNDRAQIRTNPDAYARAFGQLFAAAGHFVSLLPPPLNEYGAVLEAMEDFFVHVSRNLTYRGNTSTARGMQQALTAAPRGPRGLPVSPTW